MSDRASRPEPPSPGSSSARRPSGALGAGEALATVLPGMRSILFLCSGNVVRSAFAELYARHLACPVPVRSAATHFRNPAIFPETEAALRARGVSTASIRAFRPRHLAELEPDLGHGLALAMGRMHLLAEQGRPGRCAHAGLLGELAGGGEIRDPVLEGADFERTFERIAVCVRALVEALPPS